MKIVEIQKKVDKLREKKDIVILDTCLKKPTEDSKRITRYVDFYFLNDKTKEVFTRCLKHFTKNAPALESCKNKNYTNTKYTKESFNMMISKIKPDVELIGEYTEKFTKTTFRNNKCGHIFENTPHTMHLKNVLCPICSVSSYGELRVREYLTINNIVFEEQKTFNDMVFKNKLKLDFYIPSIQVAIEFQGRQHFEDSDSDYKDSEGFDVIKGRDQAKYNYCKNNNISLIYLDYTMIEKGSLNEIAIVTLNDLKIRYSLNITGKP